MTETAIRRRTAGTRPVFAVVLFLAVYAAALIVMFAPKEMLGTLPGSSLIAPAGTTVAD